MEPASSNRPEEKLSRDAESEVVYDFPPLLRAYKDGRVERFMGTSIVPAAAPDPDTGVFSKDVTIVPDLGVSARLYLPKDTQPGKKLPVLVYYHGGAFCIESPFSPIYHGYLKSVVSRCGVVAVSVNYRLAPEHLLPAAYEDCWAAFKWVAAAARGEEGEKEPWLLQHADMGRVFIAGDSAGGNICHWLAVKAGEEEGSSGSLGIEGMVLVQAYFWGNQPLGSESTDPKIREGIDKLWKFVCSPESKAGKGTDHPWLNPWCEGAPCASRLGCRRVLILTSGLDYFKDRSWQYYDKLRESAWPGKVEIMEIQEEEHVFHLKNPSCDRAKQMMDRLAVFFNGDDA